MRIALTATTLTSTPGFFNLKSLSIGSKPCYGFALAPMKELEKGTDHTVAHRHLRTLKGPYNIRAIVSLVPGIPSTDNNFLEKRPFAIMLTPQALGLCGVRPPPSARP